MGPYPPGTLTQHPFTQLNLQGCILFLYTSATYHTKAVTRLLDKQPAPSPSICLSLSSTASESQTAVQSELCYAQKSLFPSTISPLGDQTQ